MPFLAALASFGRFYLVVVVVVVMPVVCWVETRQSAELFAAEWLPSALWTGQKSLSIAMVVGSFLQCIDNSKTVRENIFQKEVVYIKH